MEVNCAVTLRRTSTRRPPTTRNTFVLGLPLLSSCLSNAQVTSDGSGLTLLIALEASTTLDEASAANNAVSIRRRNIICIPSSIGERACEPDSSLFCALTSNFRPLFSNFHQYIANFHSLVSKFHLLLSNFRLYIAKFHY